MQLRDLSHSMSISPHPIPVSPPLGERTVMGSRMVKGASLWSTCVGSDDSMTLTRHWSEGMLGTDHV